MATLTGGTQSFSGDTTVVDTTMRHPLGTRALDVDGNEYIYALGLDSTAAGSVVTFDEDLTTSLAVAGAVGRIGVAMAATTSSTYGWYQIYGHVAKLVVVTDGDCAADVQLYLTATPGALDDVDVTGDAVIGCISRTAETVVASQVEAEINYPFVCDAAID